ncbi:MAG: helix-turn-helix transcriptional regulator [Mesorhizobium sp.]|nr:transcriptional regulator [bacterium M00.F.Ca.ET.205.01.1.1]TGU55322.1 transcriptional regulator [bacterium M00.F.Ca.ET.152.01.1.1]TGV40388.1 transcriptional regulator [Mesorhizobium sp. M00.F.Ca.ET.186.01.1.1]TGZ45385.1 transcriptional regulator [bacterium M00.F.Ca.ET.162.01.1.1]TJW34437.1 MAG: helix-turn-helix transcriptional regulator [Mesorhizobium sp.]
MRYCQTAAQGGTFLLPTHPFSTEDCRAVSEILQRVGDKWTVLVVGKLGGGPLRFNELRAAVGGISQKMLTTTLRGLERDGFVTRTVFPTIPPRVDYELTELGHELLVPVSALGAWARKNTTRVRAAREKFDGVHV